LEDNSTFAVGHLALGYVTGKASSKLLDVNVNLPLLFLASIISDVDLLIPSLKHRGPTHSLTILFLIFIPALMVYGKRAVPYFIAAIQHSLLGDYLTGGGTQLLWPITSNWYGVGIEITSITNVYLEWIVFSMSLMLMLKTKDLWTLFKHHPSNLLLTIPVLTLILPALLSFPLAVPLELIIHHLIYLTLLSVSALIDIKVLFEEHQSK